MNGDDGMYIDHDAMKSALVRSQSFIKSAEAFALTTTSVPIEKFVEVSKWNEEVIAFLREVYNAIISIHRISEFERELKDCSSAGEKFAVLIMHLRRLLEEIKSGDDTLFRRLSLTQRIKIAALG